MYTKLRTGRLGMLYVISQGGPVWPEWPQLEGNPSQVFGARVRRRRPSLGLGTTACTYFGRLLISWRGARFHMMMEKKYMTMTRVIKSDGNQWPHQILFDDIECQSYIMQTSQANPFSHISRYKIFWSKFTGNDLSLHCISCLSADQIHRLRSDDMAFYKRFF